MPAGLQQQKQQDSNTPGPEVASSWSPPPDQELVPFVLSSMALFNGALPGSNGLAGAASQDSIDSASDRYTCHVHPRCSNQCARDHGHEFYTCTPVGLPSHMSCTLRQQCLRLCRVQPAASAGDDTKLAEETEVCPAADAFMFMSTDVSADAHI